MNKLPALLTISIVFLTAGCRLQQTTEPNPPVISKQANSKQEPSESLAYSTFNASTLYTLLAAEIAGHRDLPSVALQTYMEQARTTGDPGIAERTLEIAEYLRAEKSALEAALIWVNGAPNNYTAQRSAAIHLARAKRHSEASIYMEQMLNNDQGHFNFLDLGDLFQTSPPIYMDLLQSLDILLEKYPNKRQLILSKAHLLSQVDQYEQALKLLETLRDKKVDSNTVMLHGFLLKTLKRSDEALALLSKAIKQKPKNHRLRLERAQLLLELERLPEARADFIHLLSQSPDNDVLRYTLAQIYLQAQAWQEAAVYLEELVARQSFLDEAHFALGLAFAGLGDNKRALAEYAMVEEGDHYLSALFQRTDILLSEKHYQQSEQTLAKQRENLPQYRPQFYQMEIELLTKYAQYPSANRIAKQALSEFPDSAELLYARAMLAEKQDDLPQLERDLRKIIERDPANSMALNALGYTLVDRTNRHAEGKALIEQALALAPNDPAILDSLGWAHYRLGELSEAEPLLRKALAEFPDAEVAAHLGEVLWQLGKRKEARQIWRQSLSDNPEHAILQSTIERLTGKTKP